MTPLIDGGERFLPDRMEGAIALEHQHRYLFAMQFAQGRTVLDIASGEGYGTALLATAASHVIGVDIDPHAIANAAEKYAVANVEFRVGDCAAIPLADASVDLVVSFETLEHHDQHEQMMREIKRVLRTHGLLVISSPDKLEYTDKPDWRNPFHVKELYENEFEDLLQHNFRHASVLRQRVLAGSMLLKDNDNAALEFFALDQGAGLQTRMPLAPYLIGVASDDALPAIRGGVLEENVARLASPLLREANVQATAMIRALALSGSGVLRRRLDEAWYIEHNPDLAAADLDRYEHWINNGAGEGRVPTAELGMLARELMAEHLGASLVWEAVAGREAELSRQLRETQAATVPAREQALENLLAQALQNVEVGRLALVELSSARDAELKRLLQERDEATRNEARAARDQFAELERGFQSRIETLNLQLDSALQREQTAGVRLAQALADLAASVAGSAAQNAEAQREKDTLKAAHRSEIEAQLERFAAREAAFGQQLQSLLQDAAMRRDEAAREFARKEQLIRAELEAAQRTVKEAFAKLTLFATDAAHEREVLRLGHAAAIGELQTRLAAIQLSVSWRLTKPLRAVAGIFRRSPRSAPPAVDDAEERTGAHSPRPSDR